MAKIKTSPKLKSQVPTGALKNKWDNHKFNLKLVNPAKLLPCLSSSVKSSGNLSSTERAIG